MDLHTAIRFSLKRFSNELFAAGSILSVYSLATSYSVAVFALARRQKRRRGRYSLRALARAIFAKKLMAHESFHADVKLFVLSTILTPVIVSGLIISTSAVSTVVHAMLTNVFGRNAPIDCSSLTIRLAATVVLFLAYEIGYWFDHYIKHRIPFFWELHKLHHTAEVLTPLTNFRNHPLDSMVFGYNLAFFIGGASGVMEWLLGNRAEMFSVDGKNILFIIFLWTIGHLQHSQFWIPFRGVWGRLVLSPAHHQIHHSNDPRHYNRNLGSVLAVWDWMFGTLEVPTTENPRLTYGVDEAGRNPHSLVGILVTPAVGAALALGRAGVSIGKSLSGAWSALTDAMGQGRPG